MDNEEAKLRIAKIIRNGNIELDLSGIGLFSVPALVKNCTWLKRLNISKNYISKIENLPNNLESLNISINNLVIIENLPQNLQILGLSYNSICHIENIPTNLIELGLNGNKITNIKNLHNGLKVLYLNDNNITKIENLPSTIQELGLDNNKKLKLIENLPNGLKELHLSGNQFDRINNLPDGLKCLYLIDNKLTIVDNIPNNLEELYLGYNPTKNIPVELLQDQSNFYYNCLPDVRSWFNDLRNGKVINQTVRLFVTGNGNVGKSSLIEALKIGRCDTKHDSTHGIKLDFFSYKKDDLSVQFQVFDFGGQEIYHSTHRLFLRGKALQLVVFDSLTEETAVSLDRITLEDTRNLTLKYWLDNIHDLSPKSPIVIAQNKIDRAINSSLNLSLNLEGFTRFTQIVHVSAITGQGINTLKNLLIQSLKEIPDYGMEMPYSWNAVRETLIDQISSPNNYQLLSQDDFILLCKKHGVQSKSEAALLRYLHNTGVIYVDSTNLGDTIILDQQWALTAIYKALDRTGNLYDTLRYLSYGRTKARHLFGAWGSNYTYGQRWLLLRFMESCGLCYPMLDEIDSSPDENTFYVFPEFLSPNPSDDVLSWLSNRQARTFRQKFSVLPYYYFQTLLARWGRKARPEDIWRTGLRIQTPRGQFVLTADLNQHLLILKTDRSLSNDWQTVLRQTFGYQGNDWVEEISPGEFTIPKIELSGLGKLTKQLKDLPNIKQHRPKELVISYARQDENFVEVLRKKLSALKDNIILWYDRKLSSRQIWTDEINERFTLADGFVIFLSDDYIDAEKKNFIHNEELPIINQRFKEENIPVVMIRVGNAMPNYITLLKDFLIFDKGNIMPNPQRKYELSSAFMQKFVENWVFEEFMKLFD